MAVWPTLDERGGQAGAQNLETSGFQVDSSLAHISYVCVQYLCVRVFVFLGLRRHGIGFLVRALFSS